MMFDLLQSSSLLMGPTLLLAGLKIVRVPLSFSNFCRDCQYDLQGLRRGSPCPECGGTELKTITSHTAIRINNKSNWPLIAAIVCIVILLVLFGDVLARQLLVTSYVRDGFRADSAAIAIQVRELGDATDRPAQGLDPAAAAAPLSLFLAISPLLSLLVRRRLAWSLFIAGLTLTTIFAALRFSELIA